jgi:hypothetical protein
LLHLLIFHADINEMHGSRSKIPSKNLVRQRCADGFTSGVKELKAVTLRISVTLYCTPGISTRPSMTFSSDSVYFTVMLYDT